MAKAKPKPLVFSYIRFSTPEQSMGDSERRQTELACKWAERNGYDFDDSLRPDRGLSGYHGTNVSKGSLGVFLKQVHDGKVPPGSILVVEDIDRLGRQNVVDALQDIVFKLLQAGIAIQTLQPEQRYDRDSLTNDVGAVITLVVHMCRAHAESKRKSDLLTEVRKSERDHDRKTGKYTKGQRPAWLEMVDGELQVIPAAAKAIRRLFELKLQNVGDTNIAARLNKEGHWTPPPRRNQKTVGWRPSYVKKLLHDRQLLGERQPMVMVDGKRVREGDPIKGFFPAAITAGLFEKVQQRPKSTLPAGGPTGVFSNVLRGLAYCGYCGSPMLLVDKGQPPRGARYLVCTKSKHGAGCHARSGFRLDELLDLVLRHCVHLTPDQLLPDFDQVHDETKRLSDALDDANAKLVELQRDVDAVVTSLSKSGLADVVFERLAERSRQLQQELDQTTKVRDGLHQQLAKASHSQRAVKQWRKEIDKLRRQVDGDDPVPRQRLNAVLHDMVHRVLCFSVGYPDSETPPHYQELSDADPAFADWLDDRMRTRHARFARLVVDSGLGVDARRQWDLAPKGSCAWGSQLRRTYKQNTGRKWNTHAACLASGTTVDKLNRAYREHLAKQYACREC